MFLDETQLRSLKAGYSAMHVSKSNRKVYFMSVSVSNINTAHCRRASNALSTLVRE